MIKDLNSWEILKSNSIKIRYNPGTAIAELHNQVKPAALKKPDMLRIHIGTVIIERIATQ